MKLPACHVPPHLRKALAIDYILYPYELHGSLVFDDPAFNLVAEELVCGTDALVRYCSQHITHPAVHISSTHRPSSDCLHFLRMENNGYHTYITNIPAVPQIQLCPNFRLYYPEPPEHLWINVAEVSPSELHLYTWPPPASP